LKRWNPCWIALALTCVALPCLGCEGGDGDADADTDSDMDADADSDSDPVTRRYEYRGIAGFSMGGASAAFLGLRHPDEFDLIAPLGTSLNFTMYVNAMRRTFGGFCSPPEPDRMCPEGEFDYEHMNTDAPGAIGFERENYLDNTQDGVTAFGNTFLYNPDDPYLPPGVPRSYLALSRAEQCNQPVVVENLFDRRFNPDGTLPAITFCDGNSDQPGVFDEDGHNHKPVEVTLAIDLDGNGRRDSGEPVLMQDREPFEDVGPDGLASTDEPGYDAASNPDPSGDDWHAEHNPLGREGDGRWQEGEPYDDLGLDGVAGRGPHDLGEGNGRFDRNPAWDRFEAHDPHRLLQQADLSRLDIYADVGLRDHLGFYEPSLSFAGVLRELGRDVGVYRQFESLGGGRSYDPLKVDFNDLERDVLLVYGDPDATPSEINAGDGGHVGSPAQMLNRLLTAFKYASDRWPGGDREQVTGLARSEQHSYVSTAAGREIGYLIFLPPGYDREGTTYPVLYLLHGSGMAPGDLQVADYLLEIYMADGRLQKFIVVYPDGRCLPGECNSGNFYVDQNGGWVDGRDYESAFVADLVDHVDATYKTKASEEVEVSR